MPPDPRPEVLLLTIEVAAEPNATGAFSAPFAVDLPKKSVEMIWRVAGDNADGVSFSVAKDGEVVHVDLTDGDTSTIMRGGSYAIVDVTGASAPFELALFANVIDRSKPADS